MTSYQKIARYLNGEDDDWPLWRSDLVGSAEELRANEKLAKLRIPSASADVVARVPWYRELKRMGEEGIGAGLIENIIVHGSWGDLTFTEYSDLDLTIVLRFNPADSFSESAALRRWVRHRLYPLLYAVDPMQHHGAFILWPELLDRYDQRLLPIEVYRRCWAIRSQEIEFHPIEMAPIRTSVEARSVRALERLENGRKGFFSNGYNLYAVKRYLSNLMLVPALYAADLGRPVHKADSFDSFYATFGADSCCVRSASEMRRDWRELTGWGRPVFQRVAPGLPRSWVRGVLYFWRSGAVRRRIQEEVEPGISGLLERVRVSFER